MLNRLNTCELGVFSMMNLLGWSSWSRIVSCEALNDVEDESVNLAVEGQLASHLSLAAHSLRSVRGLRERGKSWKPDETRVFVDFFTFMENREQLSGSLTGDGKAGTLWYMGLDLQYSWAFIQILPRRTSLHWELCHMMSMFFSSPMQRHIRDDMVRQVLSQQAPYLYREKKKAFSDVSGVDVRSMACGSWLHLRQALRPGWAEAGIVRRHDGLHCELCGQGPMNTHVPWPW